MTLIYFPQNYLRSFIIALVLFSIIGCQQQDPKDTAAPIEAPAVEETRADVTPHLCCICRPA